MDAKLVAQCRSPTLITSPHGKPKYPCVVAVLARPADDISAQPTKTNVYKDSFFDHMAINHMSKCLQETTGLRNSKSGYESLVEAATMASQNFSPSQQRQVVTQALHRAFPKPMFLLSFPSPMVGVFHRDTSHLHLLGMMEVKKNETAYIRLGRTVLEFTSPSSNSTIHCLGSHDVCPLLLLTILTINLTLLYSSERSIFLFY
ncbi:hypothetical protein DEO72_LG9g1280 [Vigna unguiculata]|uniref:Uncharacterized protein n=1 Tax=Vigna unguiculata TaxID=3917 RepID=A0A4D6N1F4_VIGUN|nr:hypothetical protein DEO72_LG9g1280 [Vigna unguiculata]